MLLLQTLESVVLVVLDSIILAPILIKCKVSHVRGEAFRLSRPTF